MPFEPTDELTVTLPVAEWNQFLATYQEGVIRTLAPLINDSNQPAPMIQQRLNLLQQLVAKVTAQLQSQDKHPQLRTVPKELEN